MSFVRSLAVLAVPVMFALAPHASRAEPASLAAIAPLRSAPRVEAKPVARAPQLSTAPKMPELWLPSRGRECGGRGKYKRFCAGPRRAPLPFGPEAQLAIELGLGDKKMVSHVLLDAMKPEWIEAAGPMTSLPPLWPVAEGKYWRGFGRQKARGKLRGRRHDGVDIGAPEGTPVLAVHDGLVLYSDNQIRGYGNLLITGHADGSVFFYAHCRALYVFPGQLVTRGQVVGEVGHTGYARGSHVHFEYRSNGRLRDPLKVIDRPDSPTNSMLLN
jgi:murein DD-endopeptidase MepM/ murein hydrolase activator NlpD